ncbi:hypothetical protein DCC81_23065 [Chitinophaga parva]|uniref:POTRA domain-containing protein n=1 Tax=Chitinophaga parva TaxID=2169414 RepID=A0A2T7BDU9_9BACT|nr:hypothetical protein DCC81_23065 [Chitinophaga parva]
MTLLGTYFLLHFSQPARAGYGGGCFMPAAFEDTVPSNPPRKTGFLHKLMAYKDSMRLKHYRDSVLTSITHANAPDPLEDSSLIKSEQLFKALSGRTIRRVFFRKVKVFGPRNINDTTFQTSMKLVDYANQLHFESKEWVLRQMLFFKPGDTINPFELADNERYLRSRPFIQDARIYVVNATSNADSADVMVVTKDVFEYSINLKELSPQAASTVVTNNDLLGAGQGLDVGGLWKSSYHPQFGSLVRYTKYNILGTFIDGSIGYSMLNTYMPLDTNVYEGSYYVSLNRPLYRPTARVAGGLTFSLNHSINKWGYADSLFRKYEYNTLDGWIGYNFRQQFSDNGTETRRPSVAILLRHYNLFFLETPQQPAFKDDPVYNNRRYYLAQVSVFKQNFFKTHHFFGFGRTEDIPAGYQVKGTTGWETWIERRRLYTAIEGNRFWVNKHQDLFNPSFGIGSFWGRNTSEDAVIHARMDFYSRLFTYRGSRFRQFISADYLTCPDPYFYKPLNINNDNGIFGYKRTTLNGYQRLNFKSETVWYTPFKLYGFKFNLSTILQVSQLDDKRDPLFTSHLQSRLGLTCTVRNENLSLNTLSFSGNYYPSAPPGVPHFFVEVTTVVDLRFDISALRAPSLLPFK